MANIARLAAKLKGASLRFRIVAAHVANGLDTEAIAEAMSVKPRSAGTYVSELTRALGLRKIKDKEEQQRIVAAVVRAMSR